jgi:prevent-host-death family protein
MIQEWEHCYEYTFRIEEDSMAQIIASTDLQEHTRDFIDWVQTRSEPIVVETLGKPAFVVLPVEEYQAFLVYKREYDARLARFEQFREFARQNSVLNLDMSEEELTVLIDEARDDVYTSNQQHRRAIES